MPLFGDAKTSKFSLSVPEVRLGAMASAMLLTPADSIGLLDEATVAFNVSSVDLKGGLPMKIYDTQITEMAGTLSMKMREQSRRNMQFRLGLEPTAYAVRAETTLAAAADKASDTSITVDTGDGAKFAVGDVVCIYPADPVNAANTTLAVVTAKSTDELTLGYETLPLLYNYAVGDKVVGTKHLPLGAASTTNYFSAQVMGKGRDGNPFGFVFWKVALSSGLTTPFSAADFGTQDAELKILQPTDADLASGGPLYTWRTLVAANPSGLVLPGGDVAA